MDCNLRFRENGRLWDEHMEGKSIKQLAEKQGIQPGSMNHRLSRYFELRKERSNTSK